MRYGYGGVSYADIQRLSALLPVKSAWKNATVEAAVAGFPSSAGFEFAFTLLFLCKEITLRREGGSVTWSRQLMRLPAIAACNKLDISGLLHDGMQPDDVIEWLEYELPPGQTWSEPRQMSLYGGGITGGIDGLLTTLKTAFSASTSRKPYIVRILRDWGRDEINEELSNQKTHERLSLHAEEEEDVFVKRA